MEQLLIVRIQRWFLRIKTNAAIGKSTYMAFPSEQQLSAPLKLLHCDATTKKCSDDDCDGCVADELCFELVESATRDKSQDGVFSIV